jgi:GT2 family glycosyltransferase
MNTDLAYFSVIIPTLDRPERLAQSLAALAQMDYPRDRLEVIVVNDGSGISQGNFIKPFGAWLDLKLIEQSHAGPATARNTGAKHAKGDFLAFTDDDCAPSSNWLQTISARFAQTPGCAVGGLTINGLPANLYSTTSQTLVDYLYAYYNADPYQASFFTSNNLALPKDEFHATGGFDTTFSRAAAEDREFCDRWRRHGFPMIYAAEAIVYHMHSLSLTTFCRQHFSYGRGAFHFHRLRAGRENGRIKLEPMKFYRDLLRYRRGPSSTMQYFAIPTLLTLSQLANAVGFFWEYIYHSHGNSIPAEQDAY